MVVYPNTSFPFCLRLFDSSNLWKPTKTPWSVTKALITNTVLSISEAALWHEPLSAQGPLHLNRPFLCPSFGDATCLSPMPFPYVLWALPILSSLWGPLNVPYFMYSLPQPFQLLDPFPSPHHFNCTVSAVTATHRNPLRHAKYGVEWRKQYLFFSNNKQVKKRILNRKTNSGENSVSHVKIICPCKTSKANLIFTFLALKQWSLPA